MAKQITKFKLSLLLAVFGVLLSPVLVSASTYVSTPTGSNVTITSGERNACSALGGTSYRIRAFYTVNGTSTAGNYLSTVYQPGVQDSWPLATATVPIVMPTNTKVVQHKINCYDSGFSQVQNAIIDEAANWWTGNNAVLYLGGLVASVENDLRDSALAVIAHLGTYGLVAVVAVLLLLAGLIGMGFAYGLVARKVTGSTSLLPSGSPRYRYTHGADGHTSGYEQY